MENISRRQFLIGGGLLGAAALGSMGLTGCAPAQPAASAQSESGGKNLANTSSQLVEVNESDVSATEDCDIVVCGSGSAGTYAAVRAAELGASVIWLEKTTNKGGTSTVTEGINAPNTQEQIAAGVQFAAKHPASAPASAPTPAAVQTVTPTPEKAAEAPTESAKPAEEAPLPWDEPPLPDDYDAPPPYGEPVAPAPKAAAPKIAAAPAPAQEAPTSGDSGDDEIFYQLMESYKNRLTPDKRAFIGMAQGDVKDDLLTVYCSTEVQKSMLDQKVVTDVLSEVTSRAVGREIRVRFLVGERPGAKKRDKMQDLLRMGSKFDNFTVK